MTATKADLTEAASRIEARMAKIQGDVTLLKWMAGFNLAISITILFKVFT